MPKKITTPIPTISQNYQGKASTMLKVVEYMANTTPNATSTVMENATGADSPTVSNVRKLVRLAAGKKADFAKMPSVASRGVPRQVYQVLEELGANPNAGSNAISNTTGLDAADIDKLKQMVDRAKKTMT